jgi:hypothetical protein
MGCAVTRTDWTAQAQYSLDNFHSFFDIYSDSYLNGEIDGITLLPWNEDNNDLPSLRKVYLDPTLLDRYRQSLTPELAPLQNPTGPEYLDRCREILKARGVDYGVHRYSSKVTAPEYLGDAPCQSIDHRVSKLNAPTGVTSFCQAVINSPEHFNTIRQSLVVHAPPDADQRQINDRLRYRVPVNVGGAVEGNSDAMKKYLGYTLQEAKDIQKGNGAVLALSGLNYFLPDKSEPTRSELWRLFGAVHTWGVNLESKTSRDYQHFVANGRLDRDKYQSHMLQTLAPLIANAIDDLARRSPLRTIEVRIPFIGQGAYLDALDSISDKRFCNRVFAETVDLINRTVTHTRLSLRAVNIALPRYDGQEYDPFLEIDRCDLFRPISLFKIPDQDTFLIILNAWDDISLIGNGGFKDFTVDGMAVSGSAGMSTALYLQNPCFHGDGGAQLAPP